MNAATINAMINSDPPMRTVFHGFSTPDLPLPDIEHFPALIILNTDTSDGPGQHWCVAFLTSPQHCDFFDPLGQPPNAYHFHHALLHQCSTIQFNTFPVQGRDSSTCGHHCIFFAFHRSRNMSWENILNLYSQTGFQLNDHMVNTFIINTFGLPCARIEPVGPTFLTKS